MNTLVPFVLINLGEDFIFLPKGQVVSFLDPEYIDVSEINLDIASVTINAQSIPSTMKEKIITKNQDTIPSDFITSPADVEGPRKADLQDFEISGEEMKAFHNLCNKYECHDLKEDLMGTKFFIIIVVKYVVYDWD